MPLNGDTEGLGIPLLSDAIYDELNVEFGSLSGEDDENRKKAAKAIARAVADHIKNNGDVIITTGDSGLQQYDDGGLTDTAAPASNKTLSGAID